MDTSKLFRVDGMVAAVTGGGTGIGLVMARALLGAGAKKVYILGRRRDVLDKACAEAAADMKKTSSSTSGVMVPIECDVTSKASLQAAVDAVAQDSGYLNLLVANSGIGGPEARYGKGKSVAELRRELFEGVEMADFTHAFHVNVTGAYFTMLAFLELLDAGNKHAVGHAGDAAEEGSVFGVPAADASANPKVPAVQSQVVFTSSISAFSRAHVSGPAYSGSKAAIMHLTKHSSSNLAEHGIRVNALAPGLFPSEMANGLMEKHGDPSHKEFGHPLFLPSLRFGTEHEMAGTILYLVSRAGAYCNGSIIVEDGGRLGVMPAAY
ncbi:short chain dehydrogenase/reductase family protein [Apiospora hydei]|uniref:Short chain dehydrogenase/reductase family protein n=1 Tax=Apiospora hydei TaxID=1337664 RepID=A0ABR1USV4_9PEZI